MATRLNVAKRAGVSTATVSRVMNNPELVSQELCEKVMNAVRELDYRPNIAAKGLKTQKTYNIGYLIPDISNPYYTEIYKGINKIVVERNYICALIEMSFSGRKIAFDLNRYDGLITTPDFIANYKDLFSNIDIPIIILTNNQVNLSLKNYAIINHNLEEIISEAISYLVSQGHEKIGLITRSNASANREAFYIKAIEKHGLVFSEDLIIRYDNPVYSFKVGAATMEELLKRNTGVTAILAQNDLIAIGAMSAARRHGINIPQEISFIGCDNTVVANYSNPSLSTIKLNKEKQGEKAAQLLFDLMDGIKVSNFQFKAQLILRESTSILKI